MMTSFDDLEFHAHWSPGFSSIAKAEYPLAEVEVSIIDGWHAHASKTTYEVIVWGVEDGELEYMTEADITVLMSNMAKMTTNEDARTFMASFGPDETRATPQELADIQRTKRRKDARFESMMARLKNKLDAKE